MSVQIMNEIWGGTSIKGGDLLVALALADSADEESRLCWLSITNIATRSRITERQVQRVLRHLEEIGLLTIAYQVGQASMYRINKCTDIGGRHNVGGDIALPPPPPPPLLPFLPHTPSILSSPAPSSPPSTNMVGKGKRRCGGEGEPILEGGDMGVIPPPRRAPRRSETLIPDDFPLEGRYLTWAIEVGGYSEPEAQQQWGLWLAHHRSVGSLKRDWYHAWQYWLRRDRFFQARRPQRALALVR